MIENGELLARNVQLLERYVFSILFFPKAGSTIFQYLENFAFHVNGFYSFAVGGCYLRPEQEYTIIESVLIKM